jgi:hypothetical protein
VSASSSVYLIRKSAAALSPMLYVSGDSDWVVVEIGEDKRSSDYRELLELVLHAEKVITL